MYSLMLADDDIQMLNRLKTLVPYKKLGIRLCAAVQNTDDAIQSIERFRPDIVISDIDMPGGGGLKIIEYVDTHSIKSKFIFLTGYSSFDYAKQAISHGVFEYLTKPTLPEEIMAVLERAVHRIESENSLTTSQALFFLLSGNSNEEYIRVAGLCNTKRYLCITIHSVNPADRTVLPELLDKYSDFNLIYVPINNCICIVAENLPCLPLFSDGRFVSGVSESIYPENLHDAYVQANTCLNYCFCFPQKHIISQGDISDFVAITPAMLYNTEKFKVGIKTNDIETINDCIAEFSDNIKKINVYDSKQLKNIAFSIIDSLFLSVSGENAIADEVKNQLSQAMCLADFLKILNTAIANYSSSFMQLRTNNTLVRKIIKYINENYSSKDFTIECMAQQLYFSPSYIRHIFKQATGFTIKKQLIDVRMETAKQLILTGKYSANEIADMVGFNDCKHFRKTFKSYFGVSPGRLLP